MTLPLITAIIASSISLIGILISFFLNSRQIKQQDINIQRQLQRVMTQKLYELRLKNYPRAFEITERLKQERKPKFINPKEEIEAILKDLLEWKNGEVSLILSNDSLYLFGQLCNRLDKLPDGELGVFSQKQAENIFQARIDFRRSLRKDLGFLFDEEIV